MIATKWRSIFQRSPRSRPDAASDPDRYQDWIEKYDLLDEADRDQILRDIEGLESPPKVTILLLVRDGEVDGISDTVTSVRNQLYRRWQLLVFDVTGEADLPETLGDDPRIDFGGNADLVKTRSASEFLNAAQGSYVVFVEAGDLLSELALYCVVRTGLDQPGVQLIYSDEDRMSEQNRRERPHFKPAWSPDLLLAYNYIGGLIACRLPLVRRVGGFRSASRDCLLYDFLLRCTEGLSRDRIKHLPEILYHRRGEDPLARSGESSAVRSDSVTAAITRVEPLAEVEAGRESGTFRVRWPIRRPRPWVSVIIPTRNHHDLLSACLDSLRSITEYEGFEAVVVDNQSDDPESLAYLDSIRNVPGVRVISLEAPFNYSALNNLAVRESQGEILAFLNNDIEVLSPDWLEEMVSHAMRPKVGAVGAKLCYPDGSVQHGGVVLGAGAKDDAVAAHLDWGLDRDASGYFAGLRVVRNRWI
jgi:hypothetical protein